MNSPPGTRSFRTFVVLWLSQSVSTMVTMLTFFAINIWITQVLYPAPAQKRELALALAANGLAFALPTVFGAPLAGAWADRHDRRRTMLAMNLVAGALTATVIALMVSHRLGLPRASGALRF